MTTNKISESKAQTNSTQQTLTEQDVVLGKSPLVCLNTRPFFVMPMDSRTTEWYASEEVAQIAAKTMAEVSHGKVISRI